MIERGKKITEIMIETDRHKDELRERRKSCLKKIQMFFLTLS
jgi:hypothetical protein